MKTSLINKPIPSQPSVIYIIGDNYANKEDLMRFLLGEGYAEATKDADNHCLNFYYSTALGPKKLIEVYDFSTDRFVRQYLDLYFEILPKPDIILYCADLESSHK